MRRDTWVLVSRPPRFVAVLATRASTFLRREYGGGSKPGPAGGEETLGRACSYVTAARFRPYDVDATSTSYERNAVQLVGAAPTPGYVKRTSVTPEPSVPDHTTWMPHPRRTSNMAGTSTPYEPGGPERRARITSHGSGSRERSSTRSAAAPGGKAGSRSGRPRST